MHAERPHGVAVEHVPELDGRARAHEPQLEEGRPVLHEEGARHETAEGTWKVGQHVDVPALAHGKGRVEGTRAQGAGARDRPPAERGLDEVVRDQPRRIRGRELPDSEGHAVELPQEGGLEEVQALHDLLLVEGAESARAAGRGPSVEAGVRELRVLEKVLERAAGQGHARGARGAEGSG